MWGGFQDGNKATPQEGEYREADIGDEEEGT